MAGIGKTSLAEYIFQLHRHEFEKCCFLKDIEGTCSQQPSGLLDLQRQLLEDVRNRNLIQVRDVNVYTTMIEKALLSRQTILVLDGIDSFEQLDALLGTKGFHRGSKIIITTEDGSLTEKCELFVTKASTKHTKHLLKGLGETSSLQLLCWHAFRQNVPKEGYEEESRMVVKYCEGHPFALKVLGSSLRKEDIATWQDTLKLLEKEINFDIMKFMRISFDTLPSENVKELFKDIACFFVGEDREFTETVLENYGIRTSLGIKQLVDRCLLTIEQNNKLMMHQLLQKMGRDVVRQESPEKPWKRSRLWCHEESFNVLKEEKGTEKIQGLILDMKMVGEGKLCGSNSAKEQESRNDLHKNFRALPLLHWLHELFWRICSLLGWVFLLCVSFCHKEGDLKIDALNKMDKLRLLRLNYVRLNGSYKNFPKGLRWLSMHGFPLSYIPSDMPMENLVALDLSYSNLERLWKKPKLLQPLESLKILNLSSSKLVRVGGFSRLLKLEWLILARCASLVEVCESIGQCEGLVHLDLSYCIKLKTLPKSIGKLKKVRILSICGCANLSEFPREVKDMESLEVLNANDVNINSHVSSSIVGPQSLKSFSLWLPHSLVSLSLENNNLFNESFPMDFGSLRMFKELHLNRNPINSLPDCVRSLSRLEILSLEGCQSLKSVLCLPSTIIFLNADHCTSLEKITLHPEMSRYPYINFRYSESVTEIEDGHKVQPLAQVDEEVLRSLGWSNLGFVKNQEVRVDPYFLWEGRKKLPVQMLYQFGIFSTCFPGKELPNWCTHRCKGSSISFTMPSSPKNLTGLNLCCVRAFPIIKNVVDPQIIIRNMTKKRTWRYSCVLYAIGETNDEVSVVSLSHWMFQKDDLEEGDQVSIDIKEFYYPQIGVEVIRECGVSLMYDDGNAEGNDLAYYKSWNHIIGTDLSPFRKETEYDLRNGYYYFFLEDRGIPVLPPD